MFYEVLPLWRGQDCFILGGGPSLALVDPGKLSGKNVIACNVAYKLGHFPYMIFGDIDIFPTIGEEGGPVHAELLRSWPGEKITCTFHTGAVGQIERVRRLIPDVRVMRRINSFGICQDRESLCWNSSTGGLAMNLAYHLGVKRIILLGYDMRRVDGRANFHSEYRHLSEGHDKYGTFRRAFVPIASWLSRSGIEVWNATPGSALTEWEIVHPRVFGVEKEDGSC